MTSSVSVSASNSSSVSSSASSTSTLSASSSISTTASFASTTDKYQRAHCVCGASSPAVGTCAFCQLVQRDFDGDDPPGYEDDPDENDNKEEEDEYTIEPIGMLPTGSTEEFEAMERAAAKQAGLLQQYEQALNRAAELRASRPKRPQ